MMRIAQNVYFQIIFVSTIVLPISSLFAEWRLVGTILEDSPQLILEDSASGSQEVFKIGEKIPALGVVTSIRRNSVTLKGLDGAVIELTLLGGTECKDCKVDEAPSKRNRLPDEGTPWSQKTYEFSNEGLRDYVSDRKGKSVFGQSKQQLIKRADGSSILKLVEVDSESLVGKIGLQNGDVILSFNERPINDTGDVFVGFIKTKNTSFSLFYEREGMIHRSYVHIAAR